MLPALSKRLLSLLLICTILAPFPFTLAIPQFAYAEDPPAGLATTGGGQTTSWGSAAASGAVSLGACLAAGGLTIVGAFSGLGLGSLNDILSSAGSFVTKTFDSIFGGGGGTLATLGANNVPQILESVVPGTAFPKVTNPIAAIVANPVPVSDAKTQKLLETGNKDRNKIGLTQAQLLGQIFSVQLGIATKNSVLDCIGWAIAKMIWRQIAASIIDWINGGFNGRPAFIQNFDRFLLGIADSIAGQVIQGVGLGFLCSPFQLNIRIALALQYAQQAPSCTLTQVIANIENFMKDFSQGGWASWLQFTTSPSNNPWGGMMMGQATIALRTQDAQSQQSQQLSWGGGFLSLTQQTCQNVPVSISVQGKAPLAPQMTQRCTSKIQTPGQLIATKLSSTVNAPELSLLMADEINQIIDALSQQLILQALTGLSKLSQPSSYGDDYYRFSTPTLELSSQGTVGGVIPGLLGSDLGGNAGNSNLPGASDLLSQIDTSTTNEQGLQNRLLAAMAIIDNAIDNNKTVKSCWNDKSNTSSLSQSDREQASTQSQGQTLSLINLGDKRKPFKDGYDQSLAIMASLQDLRSQVQNTSSAAEVASLAGEYQNKKASNVYTTAVDLTNMDQTLTQLQLNANTLFQSTQIDYNKCVYFPDPVPTQ